MDTITVTVVSVVEDTDPYGDTATSTTLADYPGCLFAPRARSERANARTPAVISGGTVYVPAGVTVDADDLVVLPPGVHMDGSTVVYDGQVYAVDGEPGVWGLAGMEIAVKRWEQP